MQRTLAPEVLRLSIALLGACIALFAPPTYGTVLAIAAGAIAGLLRMPRAASSAADAVQFEPLISRGGGLAAATLFLILLRAALTLSESRNISLAVIASINTTATLVLLG